MVGVLPTARTYAGVAHDQCTSMSCGRESLAGAGCATSFASPAGGAGARPCTRLRVPRPSGMTASSCTAMTGFSTRPPAASMLATATGGLATGRWNDPTSPYRSKSTTPSARFATNVKRANPSVPALSRGAQPRPRDSDANAIPHPRIRRPGSWLRDLGLEPP